MAELDLIRDGTNCKRCGEPVGKAVGHWMRCPTCVNEMAATATMVDIELVMEDIDAIGTHTRLSGDAWTRWCDDFREKWGAEPDVRPRLSFGGGPTGFSMIVDGRKEAWDQREKMRAT